MTSQPLTGSDSPACLQKLPNELQMMIMEQLIPVCKMPDDIAALSPKERSENAHAVLRLSTVSKRFKQLATDVFYSNTYLSIPANYRRIGCHLTPFRFHRMQLGNMVNKAAKSSIADRVQRLVLDEHGLEIVRRAWEMIEEGFFDSDGRYRVAGLVGQPEVNQLAASRFCAADQLAASEPSEHNIDSSQALYASLDWESSSEDGNFNFLIRLDAKDSLDIHDSEGGSDMQDNEGVFNRQETRGENLKLTLANDSSNAEPNSGNGEELKKSLTVCEHIAGKILKRAGFPHVRHLTLYIEAPVGIAFLGWESQAEAFESWVKGDGIGLPSREVYEEFVSRILDLLPALESVKILRRHMDNFLVKYVADGVKGGLSTLYQYVPGRNYGDGLMYVAAEKLAHSKKLAEHDAAVQAVFEAKLAARKKKQTEKA